MKKAHSELLVVVLEFPSGASPGDASVKDVPVDLFRFCSVLVEDVSVVSAQLSVISRLTLCQYAVPVGRCHPSERSCQCSLAAAMVPASSTPLPCDRPRQVGCGQLS